MRWLKAMSIFMKFFAVISEIIEDRIVTPREILLSARKVFQEYGLLAEPLVKGADASIVVKVLTQIANDLRLASERASESGQDISIAEALTVIENTLARLAVADSQVLKL